MIDCVMKQCRQCGESKSSDLFRIYPTGTWAKRCKSCDENPDKKLCECGCGELVRCRHSRLRIECRRRIAANKKALALSKPRKYQKAPKDIDDNMKRFVRGTFSWMNRQFRLNYQDSIGAGYLAVIQSIHDGKLIYGEPPSEEVKRFIRREIVRAGSIDPRKWALVDHGYEHGSKLRRKPPEEFESIRLQERRRLGLCMNCGKTPEDDMALCGICRKQYNATSRRNYQKRLHRHVGTKRAEKRRNLIYNAMY